MLLFRWLCGGVCGWCTKKTPPGVLPDEFEPVSTRTVDLPLCRAEFTPLGESDGAVGFEMWSAGEASFLVEVV